MAAFEGRTGRVTVRVRFGETDAAGIVYYATYFAWFDFGTQSLCRIPGVSSTLPDGKPRFPIPMLECGARFVAPVRYDQELEIISQVVALGETSLRVEHEIRTMEGGLVARGFEQRVHVRILGDRFEKEPLPGALRGHLSTN